MASDKDIGWMYQGTKSDVNREDYLLGKRVDKNFEKYSDAIVAQKEEKLDALVLARTVTNAVTAPRISSLPLDVLRAEDPLVALRVKEESRRRDMMENPLMKMKVEKMFKEAMQKKLKGKKARKEKKQKKHDSSSDHSTSHDAPLKKRKKEKRKKHIRDDSEEKETSRQRRTSAERHRSRSKDRKRRRKDSENDKRGRRSESEEKGRKRKRRDSEIDKRGRRSDREEKQGRSQQRDMERKRRDSDTNPPSGSKKHDSPLMESRAFDSHIPAHLLHQTDTDSEGEGKQKFDQEEKAAAARFEGYGLVGVKKNKEKSDEKDAVNPYKLVRLSALPVYEKTERKKPLTHEEKQQKLKEMQENAQWREDSRVSHLRSEEVMNAAEEVEEAMGRPASFIRQMVNSATADMTMQQRLLSKKKNLQSAPAYMEKKFTSQ